MTGTVYASLYPEDALLPDSIAEKRARHRRLGKATLSIQEDGSVTLDPRPFAGRLRDGEELTVRTSGDQL